MEERQAIARLQQGDLNGLEVLVKRYQVQAVQAASLIVQDKALAEDIVQNAFIVAAEKIQQYDPQRPFGPWFFRSVVNASIKAAKARQRLVSLEEKREVGDAPLAELLADTRPQPDEWFEREEIREQVWQALDRLPVDQKAVIVMRYFLDMNESDMTEQLQRPKSTIKYLLREAKKHLRRFLTPWSANHKSAPEQSQTLGEMNRKEVWDE
jgi:RNA polymerase sigma-70 factor (ECF subfamily)